MRELNILQHLLVITCLHYLLVGTAVAAPPLNVHSGKTLSENESPIHRGPFSLLSQLRDRRELSNDALNEEAPPEQNLRKAEGAPSVQRRAVDYLMLMMGAGYDLDEKQKREVENDMEEYEEHNRRVRNADVALVPLSELELTEDDVEIKTGDGLLQRLKRRAKRNRNKKKRKGKKKRKRKKKGKKKAQKGNSKKKAAAKKKSSSKKKSRKGKKSKKGNSKKGKKQGSKNGKKSKKNKKKPVKKPKMQASVHKLKSVKPLFLTCLLHSMFQENLNPDKYLSSLVYLLKESDRSMRNMSMDSMMAMNDPSMMAMNDSAMMGSTLSLESLLSQNTSMKPYSHYFSTFGDSVSSFPDQRLPLKNIGDHNITDTELMYMRGLLMKVMSMLFMKEGTRYDVDGFVMELEMNLNESMPASMSNGENSPQMVCPPLEKSLLSSMNGLMTRNLVKCLHEGLTALLANDTDRFARGLLHEGDKSFEILYLMRNTRDMYKEGKSALLLSCLFESLFDGYVGKDILMYLLPYLADNMMMKGMDNGMMSMMDNSSMSEMMNNTMNMMPMSESNESSPMPSFNPSTIMDSQYCRNDSKTDPMMIFMYVMNMTNMTMADGDMNMTMDVLKSILAKLKRSTNESVVNAQTAPSLLLPAVMVYMENVSVIYRTKAIHHAIKYLINYGIDMKSMDMMDDKMGTTDGGMNMSSSMNQTANATSDVDMMGKLDGMGIPDAICPAVVKEFLPKMDKSAKMEFFTRFLSASKYLLCGDSEDWQEVIETGMVDMKEGMAGDDDDDDGGGGDDNDIGGGGGNGGDMMLIP